MERFNPFASEHLPPLDDPFSAQPIGLGATATRRVAPEDERSAEDARAPELASGGGASRYTTSFPDPFGVGDNGDEVDEENQVERPPPPLELDSPLAQPPRFTNAAAPTNRSNSVTFAATSDEEAPRRGQRAAGGGGGGGIGSFLSRATSVTSSSVTDRVSGAVSGVRNAVDSVSSQLKQATARPLSQADQQATFGSQQSAASYLASKFSAATTIQSNSNQQLAVISRQRVVLIVDVGQDVDWAREFALFRRGVAAAAAGGSSQGGASSSLGSFLANQFMSAPSSLASQTDLIEQADSAELSVLANQSSSTAAVCMSAGKSVGQQQQQSGFLSGGGGGRFFAGAAAKVVRPEFVVLRQRVAATQNELSSRNLAKALNYCCVPMFEPYEIWNTFQDRQLIFARLLRVQRALGARENFPLIAQVYCQTHLDLLNYLQTNSSSIQLPCLIRTGALGKGRIKVDSLQMLRDFASIMSASKSSCTIEQFLDVKYDLVVQRLGQTSLKLFKRNVQNENQAVETSSLPSFERQPPQPQGPAKQSASRQASLGVAAGGMLSSFISSTGSTSASSSPSSPRRSSGMLASSATATASATFERLGDVGARHRNWLEAIAREFDHKLEAFSLKIVVASNDREYIVGLRNCSLEFVGPKESQDEDRRAFVELLARQMDAQLPRHCQASEPPPPQVAQLPQDKTRPFSQSQTELAAELRQGSPAQQQRNGTAASLQQLANRSKSISVNQSDSAAPSALGATARRGSSSADGSQRGSLTNATSSENFGANFRDSSALFGGSQSSVGGSGAGLHQRQYSLGQSFFDSTSTAISSLQKQSLSFFKRLDARSGAELIGSTPPQSAKSDVGGFDRGFEAATAAAGSSSPPARQLGGATSIKAQSVDSPTAGGAARSARRELPPKPPPPPQQSLMNRQSSLASYSSPQRRANFSSTATPNSTPNQTRQNSSAASLGGLGNSQGGGQRASGRVLRQNSALSAFEPFDQDLQRADELSQERDSTQAKPPPASFDALSLASSGDSAGTANEQNAAAEDTMNNLKKTFASIFGDKSVEQ